MSGIPSPETAQEELNILLARAGITVPEERQANVLSGYLELRSQIALLHEARPHTAEPSNIFSLVARRDA